MKKNLIPLWFCLAAFILFPSCGGGGGSISSTSSGSNSSSSSDIALVGGSPGGAIAVLGTGENVNGAKLVSPGERTSNTNTTNQTIFAPPLPKAETNISALMTATGANAIKVDFFSSSDWQEENQSSSPDRLGRKQSLFNTCAPGFSCNGLSLYTRQGSDDRIKYYSKNLNYSYGSYTWRLYVPPGLSSSERFSIGAFLRSDYDYREIDFEIGYGTSAERADYNRVINDELGDQDLLLYATNQGLTNRGWIQKYCGSAACTRKDADKKTVTVVSQSLADSDSQKICTKKKIRSGIWYDLTISFERIDDKHSRISWYISSELIQSTVVDFGMCTFQVYCSVENLNFIGDHATTSNRYGYFAWIQFDPGNAIAGQGIQDLSSR